MKPSIPILHPDSSSKPLIVGTICDDLTLSAVPSIPTLPEGPDLIEIRVDQLLNVFKNSHRDVSKYKNLQSEFREWMRKCVFENTQKWTKRQLILTVRVPGEGGGWPDLTLEERLKWYREFEPFADYIDLEILEFRNEAIRIFANEVRQKHKKVIGSFHDFQTTPTKEHLDDVIQQAIHFGEIDLIKIAVMLHSASDMSRLLSLLKSDVLTTNEGRIPLSVMGMGSEWGQLSRLAAATMGSVLNYAYLGNATTVPGQWPVDEYRRRIEELSNP